MHTTKQTKNSVRHFVFQSSLTWSGHLMIQRAFERKDDHGTETCLNNSPEM